MIPKNRPLEHSSNITITIKTNTLWEIRSVGLRSRIGNLVPLHHLQHRYPMLYSFSTMPYLNGILKEKQMRTSCSFPSSGHLYPHQCLVGSRQSEHSLHQPTVNCSNNSGMNL